MASEKGIKNGKSKSQNKKKKDSKPNLWILGLSEFVGTALLLLMGCMGCIMEVDGIPLPHHLPSISFGLTVMLIIQTFGHISGAHLNPAVTLAALLLGYLKPICGVVYVAAQFAGAFAGFGLLKILTPLKYTTTEVFNVVTNTTTHRAGLCSTTVMESVTVMQALAIETIATGILILVCCAVWDKRNSANLDSLPLRFGLIIACIGMALGPYTGPSLNTPRSLAPAVFNGDWDEHWIYWVGPTLGAIVGAGFYRTFFKAPDDEETEEEDYELEDLPLNQKSVA